MKLEDQVCSLELARKLKELGVKQESYFVWEYSYIADEMKLRFFPVNENYTQNQDSISAFTVAELGEMLPHEVFVEGSHWTLNVYKYSTGAFQISYRTFEGDGYTYLASEESKTEADARAKMLIHLIEKGILTPGGRG